MNDLETCRDNTMERNNKRPRCSNFSEQESTELIKLWAMSSTVCDNKNKNNKSRNWEEISSQMQTFGYPRGPAQCKIRVQNLVSKFYKLKNSNYNNRQEMSPLFKLIETVLQNRNMCSSENGYPTDNTGYDTNKNSLKTGR